MVVSETSGSLDAGVAGKTSKLTAINDAINDLNTDPLGHCKLNYLAMSTASER